MPLLKHEIIVFSDANNLYAQDAMLELMKPFSDPGRRGDQQTHSR
jgi:hypothetical protein